MVETDKPQAQSNGLGVAGFVVSLVGLCPTCALIPAVGLTLSLFGLRKRPRGFAIAGVVIGAFGLCVTLLIYAMVYALLSGATSPEFEVKIEFMLIQAKLSEQTSKAGSLPKSLGSLGLPSSFIEDPWDNPYVYAVDPSGTSFTLSSSGPDGIPGNSDDLTN